MVGYCLFNVKTLRWLFILFQIVWLNAVVPGHTRGAMRVFGNVQAVCPEDAARQQPSCCQTRKLHKSEPKVPTRDDRECCAVCWFALGLDVPVWVDLVPPLLALVDLLPITLPQSHNFSPPAYTYHTTGPPVADGFASRTIDSL